MIPFTQYLRPDGRKIAVHIHRAPCIEHLANQLLQRECYFDAEVLTTGRVSLTCERELDEIELVSSALVDNIDRVPLAVDRLISQAASRILFTPGEYWDKRGRCKLRKTADNLWYYQRHPAWIPYGPYDTLCEVLEMLDPDLEFVFEKISTGN